MTHAATDRAVWRLTTGANPLRAQSVALPHRRFSA